MARDFQRQRVWDAEDASPDGPAFFSIAGMQSFVDRITRTRFYRNRAPSRYWSIVVDLYSPRKGCEDDLWADRRRRRLHIPEQKDGSILPVSEEELIHELAHFVSPVIGHGPEFVRALIDLTRHFHSMPTRARVLAEKLVDKGARVQPVPGTGPSINRTASKKTRN
jgi:putative metallohydrolase (TIGR04338 family)